MITFVLPLLMQVGPAPQSIPIEPLPIPRSRPPLAEAPAPAPAVAPAKLAQCLEQVGIAPAEAAEEAETWLDAARGLDRALAGHCIGLAQAALGEWTDAATSFENARDAVPTTDAVYRARLGALAGNAALAAGDAARALAALDFARIDAGGQGPLAGGIAMDRARALVQLERLPEATEALSTARAAIPADAQVWLLSATLDRRTGDLAAAQAHIERAASLDARDPAIGLEAGVIAVLSGRDAAARASWRSVIELAPGSEAAASAQAYLDQLGTP